MRSSSHANMLSSAINKKIFHGRKSSTPTLINNDIKVINLKIFSKVFILVFKYF